MNDNYTVAKRLQVNFIFHIALNLANIKYNREARVYCLLNNLLNKTIEYSKTNK